MSLPQRIKWFLMIAKCELKAREGFKTVEFVKGLNAVVFVWKDIAALMYFVNYVGYFKIEGLDAHHYYAPNEVISVRESAFVKIYHRLDYHDGHERIDTGWIWK